jgi:hypothetical protein
MLDGPEAGLKIATLNSNKNGRLPVENGISAKQMKNG